MPPVTHIIGGRSLPELIVHSREREVGVADKKGLRVFGFVLGGVTIAVALVAAVTVQAHINSGMASATMNPHMLTSSR